mgnify:CR=1 FL=1|tara:strand:+ start:353 stop:1966 length:1614 start_codon:yes stop_codon:yes gene_type:complete
MAEENREIFVGSGASLTFVPETRLYVPLASSSGGVLSVHSDYDGLRLVDKMYIGCSGEYYNSTDNLQGRFTVTGNELDGSTQKITISPSFTWAANDYIILDAYGTPCPAPRNGDYCRLNADNWLGLLESANFPSTDIEMKQLNLQLGGTRNWTHQYKGIETASGANLNLIANHGAWLYYALGKCTSIAFENGSGAALDGATITTQMGSGAVDGKFMIETASGNGTDTSTTAFVDDGPIFYRGIASPSAGASPMLIPPVPKGEVTLANLDEVNAITESNGLIALPITYTFDEANNNNLPSFALEQTFSKLPSSNKYRMDTDSDNEDLNFVKVARGNRVNTMTITANENEEVKITMDLNTRQVFSFAEGDKYEARRAVEDETAFVNFSSNTDTPTFLEPFFFSGGTLEAFNQTFLKITNLTLTINNNLQDKRFVGSGSKSIKNALPAQRTYEISFTGLVTDDKLYKELVNNTENRTTNYVVLKFTKDNNEEFELKFKDYMVTASNWPIPDDKGPVAVESTIMPRNLHSCTVKTHWILQG